MSEPPTTIADLGLTATDFEALLAKAEVAVLITTARVTINDIRLLAQIREAYTKQGLSAHLSQTKLDYLHQLAAR